MPNCLCIMRRGVLWVYGIAIRMPLAAPIKKKADRTSCKLWEKYWNRYFT